MLFFYVKNNKNNEKSVCLSQDSNLGSQIYLYGLIQPIRGRNRVKGPQKSSVNGAKMTTPIESTVRLIDCSRVVY